MHQPFTQAFANREVKLQIARDFMTSRCSAVLCASLITLTACGGGGGGESNPSTPVVTPTPADTTLTLLITDAPVDSASEVVVQFSGVAIKPADSEEQVFEFDEAKSIDLLALQGSNSAVLLDEQTIDPGDYEWIRLAVNAELGVRDSYMVTDGQEIELRIPSGSQTGLKLVSGFTVATGGAADFTIDFDVRKSITNPPGLPEAILKPALRLVNNQEVGEITGEIAPEIISESCAAEASFAGAVYLYEGADIAATDLGHVDAEENVVDPFTTALVKFEETEDGSSAYNYEFGFIAPGDYSLAFTCSNDDPENDEREVYSTGTLDPPAEEGEPIIIFYGNSGTSYSVTVTADVVATQNFELPTP
jgi:hypothetical protein